MGKVTLYDLSHPFGDKVPLWPWRSGQGDGETGYLRRLSYPLDERRWFYCKNCRHCG